MSITLGTGRQADSRGLLAIQSRLKPRWPPASKKDPVPKTKEEGNPEKTTCTDLGLPKKVHTYATLTAIATAIIMIIMQSKQQLSMK